MRPPAGPDPREATGPVGPAGAPGAPAPRSRRKRSSPAPGCRCWWPYFSGGTNSYEVFDVNIRFIYVCNFNLFSCTALVIGVDPATQEGKDRGKKRWKR